MLNRDYIIYNKQKQTDIFPYKTPHQNMKHHGKLPEIVKYVLPLAVSAGIAMVNLPTMATDTLKNNTVPYTVDIRTNSSQKLPVLQSVDLPKANINKSTLIDSQKNIKIPDKYSYDVLQEHLSCLKQLYPSMLEVLTIGKSVQERELYTIKIGNGPNKVLVVGASHAREVISTQGIMEFVDKFLATAAKPKGGSLYGNYNVKDIMNQTTLYIVPMLNPDGVEIVYKGLPSGHPLYAKYKANPQTFKTRFKSNFNGVDLNRQFPYKFEEYKKSAKNPKRPASEDWCGTAPLSEPETAALADFTAELLPSVALSVHCTGNVIFSMAMKTVPEIESFGKKLATAGKLTLSYPSGNDMVGYVDWLGAEYKKYGILPYTIELGKPGEPTPIPVSRLYGKSGIMDSLTPIIVTSLIYNTPLSPWNVKK